MLKLQGIRSSRSGGRFVAHHGSASGRGLHRRPEDPGPVRVRVYILNGQPGPGRVPIYYFGSRVCLTLCVIPESIGEHRTCQ